MTGRIDLSTVPSLMEQTAASWKGKAKMKPKVAPKRQVFAKRTPTPVKPERIARRKSPQPRRESSTGEGGYGSQYDRKLDSMEERARRLFLRQHIAELPDPARYARSITVMEREGLLTARQTNDGWVALPDYVPILRSAGLCEVGGLKQPNLATHNRLGPFGEAVRRYVLADERALASKDAE